MNLVDNALKYSSPPARVTVAARNDGSTFTFWVSDEGIGIEPGDLPRIFERFYQVDQSATRSYGGVGLGLHIVSGLLETIGGSVDVQSDAGRRQHVHGVGPARDRPEDLERPLSRRTSPAPSLVEPPPASACRASAGA